MIHPDKDKRKFNPLQAAVLGVMLFALFLSAGCSYQTPGMEKKEAVYQESPEVLEAERAKAAEAASKAAAAKAAAASKAAAAKAEAAAKAAAGTAAKE